MEFKMLAEMAFKYGVGIVAVIAGIWMLWYMIKFILTIGVKTMESLTKAIENLILHIKEFSAHVHREHRSFDDCQKQMQGNQAEMQKNQQQMIASLRETANILGRINGYKKD